MLRKIIKILKTISQFYPVTSFKIVGITGNPKNKNTVITYKVSGKSTVATEKPSLLIKELMQIKGFSKQDSQLIYDLAIAEKISYSFRIISIHTNEVPIKFEIEDIHSNYTLLLTAEEIISTNKILENFSPSDISMIYFQIMKDYEHSQVIKKSKFLNNDKQQRECNVYFLQNPGVNE